MPLDSTQQRVKPNTLDRVISYFSPAAGYKRMRFREAESIHSSFDAAKTGRRTANWATSGASANAENTVGRPLTRDRSRDLIRNNPLARNGQGKWADSIVGPGILCKWEDPKLQEKWDTWCKKASADGLPHFEAVEYLACQAEFESGESLLRFRPRRKSDGVWPPFQVQVLESDYIDSEKSMPTDGGGYIINGIEHNGIGRIIAYWLFEQHPGDANFVGLRGSVSTMSKRVDASEISHVFDPTRPGQVRGIPRLIATTLAAKDTADWEDAEIVRKRTEACTVAAIESPEGDSFEFNTEVLDANGNKVSTFEPGMFLKTKPGEQVKFFQPTSVADYAEYKDSRQMDFAAGASMPYELLTGNYSHGNYSASRMGVVAYERRVCAMQWNVIIPRACEAVAVEFLRLITLLDGPVANPKHEWNPPAFNLLDRLNEAKADAVELGIGKTSWPQLASRTGNDPRKLLAEIIEYADKLKEAGVDFFGGQILIADQNSEQQSENEPKPKQTVRR